MRLYKLIKCNMPECEKTFNTEIDKIGVPYKKRCPSCSNILRKRNKSETGIYKGEVGR